MFATCEFGLRSFDGSCWRSLRRLSRESREAASSMRSGARKRMNLKILRKTRLVSSWKQEGCLLSFLLPIR
jgi:hypothetical protein